MSAWEEDCPAVPQESQVPCGSHLLSSDAVFPTWELWGGVPPWGLRGDRQEDTVGVIFLHLTNFPGLLHNLYVD